MSRKNIKSIKNVPKAEMVEKSHNEEYAVILSELGGGRFKLKINMQDKEVIGVLPGKFKRGFMKKINKFEKGSVILISFRGFQNTIVDIIHKYDNSEINKLKKAGELLFDEDSIKSNRETGDAQDIGFDFDEI